MRYTGRMNSIAPAPLPKDSPLAFLASLMEGFDPRCQSKLSALVQEIGPRPPSPAEWAALRDMVLVDYKPALVSLRRSQAAAKVLAEYRHGKRQAIDVNHGEASSGPPGELTPLEVHEFSELFNAEF